MLFGQVERSLQLNVTNIADLVVSGRADQFSFQGIVKAFDIVVLEQVGWGVNHSWVVDEVSVGAENIKVSLVALLVVDVGVDCHVCVAADCLHARAVAVR